jgi:hypothetical protein
MVKLQQDSKKLTALQVSPAGLLSARHDLKEYVFNSPSEFFAEIGQRLFLIAKDVEVCSKEKTSIDLLALDEQGQAVVILLAKGQDATILARAISCAGLIAGWQPADFLSRLNAERMEALHRFLDVAPDAINREQRAILISEFFDFEILAASRWLWERNGMDMTCVRIYSCLDPETQAQYIGCVDLSEAVPATAPAQSTRGALLRLAAQHPQQGQSVDAGHDAAGKQEVALP